jgi:phage terminase large subunit-like protein
MTPEEANSYINQLDPAEQDQLLHTWEYHAREEQLPPDWNWFVWMYLAGRGAGKTRSGAEWVRDKIRRGFTRGALIAPTAHDARYVMVEGDSGIIACSWVGDMTYDGEPMGIPQYEPSNRRLVWPSIGAQVELFSAEEPERLRGPQHEFAWADEVAAWGLTIQDTWDMLMFGLRIGTNPQVMATTTPKPLPLIREIVKDKHNAVSRGTTYDNRANLAKKFFDEVVKKYEGTRLGRQELNAEILDDVEGALWKRSNIKIVEKVPDMLRIVVGVDPATSSRLGTSALTGIVAAGLGVDGKGYVLADRSGRKSPMEWAMTAVATFDEFEGDMIVGEGNQGGDMVRSTIEAVRPNAPVAIVHASRSKQARAEPIAALYEQGKVVHVGNFADLEDQLCTWEPLSGMPSPDRLDAMVWALTELMVGAGAMVHVQADEDFIVAEQPKERHWPPGHWPRAAAMHIDSRTFAAVFTAVDRKADVIYVYDEVVMPLTNLAIHAEAMTTRGAWIPALFDLKASRRTAEAGVGMAHRLANLGVNIFDFHVDTEAAAVDVGSRLSSGRLRVFKGMEKWVREYRQFRRDEKGEIDLSAYPLMAATALLCGAGIEIAMSENQAASDAEVLEEAQSQNATGY